MTSRPHDTIEQAQRDADDVIATHRAYFERAIPGEGAMPDYSIMEWYERADAEIGYLKVTIREFVMLEAELQESLGTP